MHRTLPLALVLALLAGCNSFRTDRGPAPTDFAKGRLEYIDTRATELIKQGVPKDVALSKASGEWFSRGIAVETQAEANRRAEQQILRAKLDQLARDRGRY